MPMKLLNQLTTPRGDQRYVKARELVKLYIQSGIGLPDEDVYITRDESGNLIFKDLIAAREYSLAELLGDIGILFKEFSFADIVAGSNLLIGACASNSYVEYAILEVLTPFDGNYQITVGDMDAQGRLMTASENYLPWAGKYKADSDVNYEIADNLYLFFTGSVLPTQGTGHILIYLK